MRDGVCMCVCGGGRTEEDRREERGGWVTGRERREKVSEREENRHRCREPERQMDTRQVACDRQGTQGPSLGQWRPLTSPLGGVPMPRAAGRPHSDAETQED